MSKTKRTKHASKVLGILSIVLGIISPLVGWILGIIGLSIPKDKVFRDRDITINVIGLAISTVNFIATWIYLRTGM